MEIASTAVVLHCKEFIQNRKICFSMIRLYHKNRHRFTDPRGTLLKIFEKPIGRVESIQEKLENNGHSSPFINLFNNSKNLAPNYSLLPLIESGLNSEILSEDLIRQFLEKNCQPKNNHTIINKKASDNLSDNQFEKISRTEIHNLAEDRLNHGKESASGVLNRFSKYYMDTKIPWLHLTTFMGRVLAEWSHPHHWYENLSHWAMEVLVLLLLLVGDNIAMAKLLTLFVGISLGVKMSRNSPVSWTRSSALEENRGRWHKKISSQEGYKEKDGTKSSSWGNRMLCAQKTLGGAGRKYASKVAGTRRVPCPTSSGSSRHGTRLSPGVGLVGAPTEKVRGPPDKPPGTVEGPALVTLIDTSVLQDPETAPETHMARPQAPIATAPNSWPNHLASSATRRGTCTAMPTTLHELEVMLSNPCSACSDIHIIDTQYTTELLNPHLGTSHALVLSKTSPREVFSQPSLNTISSIAQPMPSTHPSHDSTVGCSRSAILGDQRQQDTTGTTTISGRVTASQEAPSLAMGSLLGGQRQRTTSNESALAQKGVTHAQAGETTGVTPDYFSPSTYSFSRRNFSHISKDGGNSREIFKNTPGHIVALPNSPMESSHANVACIEQDSARLGAHAAECAELKENVCPPVAVEAGQLRDQSQSLTNNDRQKTYVWPPHRPKTSVPAKEPLRHDAKVTATQHGVALMDAEGCPQASPNVKASLRRPGKTLDQAEQRAITAPGVTIDSYCPSLPVSLRNTSSGTTKLPPVLGGPDKTSSALLENGKGCPYASPLFKGRLPFCPSPEAVASIERRRAQIIMRNEKMLLDMEEHRLRRAALRGQSRLSLKPQGLGRPTALEMTHDFTIGCAAAASAHALTLDSQGKPHTTF